MKSHASQYPVGLALQIQALTTDVEELARHNQEMRSQLQQEGNCDTNRNKDEVNSNIRNGFGRVDPSIGDSNDLLKSIQKEMDELKNAMKEKTNKNLDGMVKRTDSLFTTEVLEYPLRPKFRLPQLESFDGLKDPLDHITTFKMILNLHQIPDEILCKSFLATLKGVARVWFSKLTRLSIDDFEQV